MAFVDKTIVCKECGDEFTFTAEEQEFFAEKGFKNEPSRCKACRSARRSKGPGRGASPRGREMFDVICSKCGKQTQVPFKPTNNRPVYCSDCYRATNTRSRW